VSGYNLYAFELPGGQVDPWWGASMSNRYFDVVPATALSSSDDRLFFLTWERTFDLQLLEVDAHGQVTQRVSLPEQSAFTPTPDGGLLVSRSTGLLHVEASGETPVTLGGHLRLVHSRARGRRAWAVAGRQRPLRAALPRRWHARPHLERPRGRQSSLLPRAGRVLHRQ
jgi:hypothetical protein